MKSRTEISILENLSESLVVQVLKCLATVVSLPQEMSLESINDMIFGLPNILYTTLTAGNEVCEVRALAGNSDLAGVVPGHRAAKEIATNV